MDQTRYILSRLGQSLLALFCIITITFFIARLAPGGPFNDDKAVPAHIQAKMEAYYGLDKPLPVQYIKYIGNLLTGDFGSSFGNKGFTVAEVIAQGAPISLAIGLGGLLFALAIGIPLGTLAASRKNTKTDYFSMSFAMLGICIPTFVVGPLLAIFFGLRLGWFNAWGWFQPTDWILPSLTLGIYYGAYIARLTRGGMLEILGQDYIRTARAKGVSQFNILFGHAFRGGIIPVVNFLGPALAGLISGSFVVETIFGLDGLGQHFITAATNRDYPLILGTVFFYAVLIITVNFLVDLLQVWLNPRLRAARA